MPDNSRAKIPRLLRQSLVAIFLPLAVGQLAAQPQLISSVTSSSASAGGESLNPIISRDGRYVLFSSYANNLVTNSAGGAFPPVSPARLNVFLRDRTNGTTTLISINTNGTAAGNADSFAVAISSNGQFALFESTASNLVAGDTNNLSDIFVRDVVNGTTLLVSIGTNNTPANGISRNSVMTPDGRYVAFVSAATNLVANDTNSIPDIFVRDLLSGTTTLASVGALATTNVSPLNTSESPALTPDGRYVAFYSTATNLVSGITNADEVYVRDLVNSLTILASTNAHTIARSVWGSTNVVSYDHAISDDGQFVAFQTTTNVTSFNSSRQGMVLRHNLATGVTDIVNTNTLAAPSTFETDYRSLDLTPDGRYVAFITNLNALRSTDAICVWDAQANTTTLVSADLTNGIATNSDCYWPQLSADGRYVAFFSSAANLTTNTPGTNFHLYVHDLQLNVTTLVDARLDGSASAFSPSVASISTNGLLVAFDSLDPNLSANDANRAHDIFVRNVSTGTTELISAAAPALPSFSANGPNSFAASSISTNARCIAFMSDADNLVPNDTNQLRDVFVHDLLTGGNTLVSISTNGTAANGLSTDSSISGDGRYIAFTSFASNLVAGDNNNTQDVFVRDLQTGITTLVSSNQAGTGPGDAASYSPTISFDGRYVLFQSRADNLVTGFPSGGHESLFRSDLQSGTMLAIATNLVLGNFPYYYIMTPDARFAAFSLNSPGIAVWDLTSHQMAYTNNSVAAIAMALSPDGKKFAFASKSAVTFVDLVTKSNTALGNVVGNSHVTLQFSEDGRLLAYTAQPSGQSNQVYLFDTQNRTNLLVSKSSSSANGGNNASDSPVISVDGNFITYRSAASDIVPGNAANVPNIFLYNRLYGTTSLLTASRYTNAAANSRSLTPVFSPDSQTLLFESWATDLVPQDFNADSDLFAFSLISTNSTPAFPITLASPATLSWTIAAGKNYQVQFKNNLSDANWQILNGHVTLTGSQASAADLAPATARRFYRVVAY